MRSRKVYMAAPIWSGSGDHAPETRGRSPDKGCDGDALAASWHEEAA
jgi:hypothetical protein